MSVEVATATDVEQIVRVVNDAYRGASKAPGWTHETALMKGSRVDSVAVLSMIEAPDSTVLVTRHERAIVGCVALHRLDEDEWYLSMLAVDPDCQANNMGKTVMAGAEKFAHAHGARRMQLSVINLRESLIAWYERQGYVRTGAVEPFPYDDATVGTPMRGDLALVTLTKALCSRPYERDC